MDRFKHWVKLAKVDGNVVFALGGSFAQIAFIVSELFVSVVYYVWRLEGELTYHRKGTLPSSTLRI